MDTKSIFSHLNLVLIFALLSLGGNHVLASVFAGRIANGGGGRARVPEKEPVPEYLQSVVSCKLGEPHRLYPECRCGERVGIVPEDEIPLESLEDYHVRVKHTHKGIRHIYYHCLFCSQCLDGVRILSNCSRMIDTQCTASCIKATDIFDKGRKACVPNPRFEEDTTKSADQTNLLNVGGVQAEGERTNRPSPMQNSDNHTPNGSSSKSLFLADDTYLVIVGWALVAAVVIVLIVNIFICKYFYHRRKRDQGGEQDTKGIISSTSKESVSDV